MLRLRSRAFTHLRANTATILLQLPAFTHARYALHAALHMHLSHPSQVSQVSSAASHIHRTHASHTSHKHARQRSRAPHHFCAHTSRRCSAQCTL
mmetsp:Transcript_4318/g.9308  ORF Transcript_4318/g.9308 Transcript_4318/m.9308 type:complete len:95 (+) Transcript_4318:2459-2743(+)